MKAEYYALLKPFLEASHEKGFLTFDASLVFGDQAEKIIMGMVIEGTLKRDARGVAYCPVIVKRARQTNNTRFYRQRKARSRGADSDRHFDRHSSIYYFSSEFARH